MTNTSRRKRIIIATDSFKGSLTSLEAGQAIAAGLHSLYPDTETRVIPMADGGEGSSQAVAAAIPCRWISVETCDPLHRPMTGKYVLTTGGAAMIDLAAASGLTLLSAAERNPLYTSTYGTGLMIADALRRGIREIVLFAGGSATNDAASGLLSALGFEFRDSSGKPVTPCGEALEKITAIDNHRVIAELRQAGIRIACDVTNPFTGERGATKVYAPQKGASASDVEWLEAGMKRFAALLRSVSGTDITSLARAGAAGGVGGAMHALLGADLSSGAEMIMKLQRFDELLEGAAMVITGEGRSDSQTLEGKAPARVLRVAQERGIPVVLISGRVDTPEALLRAGFNQIIEASPRELPLVEAMNPDIAAANLSAAAARINL